MDNPMRFRRHRCCLRRRREVPYKAEVRYYRCRALHAVVARVSREEWWLDLACVRCWPTVSERGRGLWGKGRFASFASFTLAVVAHGVDRKKQYERQLPRCSAAP